MNTAVRPWVTTGVAIVGASVIAVTPVTPIPDVQLPEFRVPTVHLTVPEMQLTASIEEIFTFPVLRQYILNQITDLANLAVGLGQSGAGLGAAIAAIPPTLVTVTQQVLSGDLLGALTTIEDALIDAGAAVILPTLDAVIANRQRVLAVQSALQVAVPTAIVQFGGGILGGIDTVTRAFITAGQDLVDAVLSFNVGNIVNALVNGTTLVLGSFVDAGGQVVDGTVAAQNTLATALAATPPPAMMAARTAAADTTAVTAVPDLTDRKVATLSVEPSTADAPDADLTTAASEAPTEEKPSENEAPKSDNEAPKADEDKDESEATDDTSAPADEPDHPGTQAPKQDAEKGDAAPNHDAKKADNESGSEGAE